MTATPAALRRDVARINERAKRDLDAVWRGDPAAAAGRLRSVLPPLVSTYGLAAATTAATWYDEARSSRGVRGRFSAIPADIPEPGTQSLIGWAASEAHDLSAFRTLVLGGTQRRIANFARLTITGSSAADPMAQGWVRVGSGECDWCQQYLDGEVRTVAYDFPAHDHCNCAAVPAF